MSGKHAIDTHPDMSGQLSVVTLLRCNPDVDTVSTREVFAVEARRMRPRLAARTDTQRIAIWASDRPVPVGTASDCVAAIGRALLPASTALATSEMSR